MRTWERLWAIVWKEWLQVFRDPSALLIAFVFPAVMLFLFGYGLSLDAANVRIGVVLFRRDILFEPFGGRTRAARRRDARGGRRAQRFFEPRRAWRNGRDSDSYRRRRNESCADRRELSARRVCQVDVPSNAGAGRGRAVEQNRSRNEDGI